MRFVLLLSLLLSGCASVPDVLICTELNMNKGWCTRTISNEEFFVDDTHPYAFDGKKKQTWWELRPYMVLVPIASWAEIKSYVIKTCKRSNCNEYVKSWDRKITELDDKAVNQ